MGLILYIGIPIFIVIMFFVLANDFAKNRERKELLATIKSTKASDDTDERFPCPSCAEMVLVEAKVCRYCGRELMRDITPEDVKLKSKWTREEFNAAIASGDNLSGANLTGVDLRETDLSWAILRGAILTGVNLSETDLRYANLRGADLRKANLSGANLNLADLREASLTKANLSKAYLFGADLRGADLSDAKYNSETKWPEGFDPEAAEAVLVEDE